MKQKPKKESAKISVKDGQSNYKKIGFMCGLEIHQRLATREKLFCSCTTTLLDRSARPSGSIVRFQRAVAGELGSVDKSAEFEGEKNRSFTYNIFDHNTCLVDIDEEPPHSLNAEALEIALAVSSAMNMQIVDELQPMRKAVVDGSDPSAFQRTIMVGLEGRIEVGGNKVNIPTLFLEEESSGIVSSTSSSVIYNTDRLGVPLLEIDTDANIPDPKTAKEIALYIGTMLRLTGMVQRGIGSIRQDVNLSIKDGARVEIKGVQELGFIDIYLENEIKRQQNLLTIKSALRKAKAKVGNPTDVTHLFKNTNVEVIRHHVGGGAVFAFPLFGFRGMLGFEINPNRRLGTEISDYAKMAGVHGIIHSDEDLNRYKFTPEELAELKRHLKISDKDSFIIIAGSRDEARRAIELAIWRAKYALEGVPKETRMAHDNENHTSRFMRPLPTGSRMYPETDVEPVQVTEEMSKRAAKSAPSVEKERSYIKSMVKNSAIVEQLILSPRLQLFKMIAEKSRADPEFVANVLIQKLTELRRSGINVDAIRDESIIEVFWLYAEERITKQAVEEAIKIISKNGGSLEPVLSKFSLERIKGSALKELVDRTKKENPGVNADVLLSRIMSKYRLNVDGSELNSLLSKKK